MLSANPVIAIIGGRNLTLRALGCPLLATMLPQQATGTKLVESTPDGLAATMKAEMARIGKVIKNAGSRME
jgi:hypothetical protein